MATLEEVNKIMGVMAAAYPNFGTTPATIKIYAQLLSDIPMDILEKAARQAMATSEFFPTIAKIRDNAMNIQIAALNIPTAGEAWNEVCKAIRREGHGSKPKFSHPLIQKAVDGMGGFDFLCLSEQPEWDRTWFTKGYNQLYERAEKEARFLPEIRQDVFGSGTGREIAALADKLSID